MALSTLSLQRFSKNSRRLLAALVMPLSLMCAASSAIAQDIPGGCGNLSQSWGPFDYRADKYIYETTYRSHDALLRIVEHAHFTAEVEALIRGKTGASPGGDIAYTLGVFPNHHRALLAIISLGEKEKVDKPIDMRFTIECYFRRALTWRPDDRIVKMIYARYLAKTSREAEADQQLVAAANLADDNAFTYNNIGLIYFDMKKYDKALFYAHKAYALGLAIPNLREQLVRVGKWSEQEPVSESKLAAPQTASQTPP